MKKFNRTAFTLIEMLVAISIFSIMMLYLYKTYSTVNISNDNLKVEANKIKTIEALKKVVFLDYSLALYKPNEIITIDNRESNEDFIHFQSSHSIHRRINPYIIYMVKNKKLYRLESLKKISSYEMSSDAEFDIDFLGDVNSFRVYKSTNKNVVYLIAINFKKMGKVLLKVKPLNEY
ncbi:prepilin-type N-terminal cleavage/methylation domain-containing protein [Sulfurimonas sp.]|uniref:PulJ/GspJ family protein n=1 Tax=Sulfurimonas sp. TaxID=2022749 RepID=UPI00261C3D3A|nr:prepilin-type N-terminal cleavage/methylation domain-containing protein [Sulfurimonas sp.]